MNGQSIGWDESSPADTENAGLGDDRMRSIKTSTRIALDDEHAWPSAGGLAGYHRFGSARPYYGTESRVSSSGTDSRLMVTSDTSRLFGVGSGGTVFFGGESVPSRISSVDSAGPQRNGWFFDSGVALGGSLITFAQSGFSGRPVIVATAGSTSTIQAVASLDLNVTSKQSCMIFAMDTTAGAPRSDITVHWMSWGSRAY